VLSLEAIELNYKNVKPKVDHGVTKGFERTKSAGRKRKWDDED
jgi:hypothetical protein